MSGRGDLPPPSAGEGTLRSRGGEGSDAAGGVAPGVTSSTVALPLSQPRLTPGPPSPAEGGGDAREPFSSKRPSSFKLASLPPPSAGEGTLRNRGGEGNDAAERDPARRRCAPVSPRLRDFAKDQRRLRTKAEDQFWQQVRAGRFHGLKFRRQAPIPPYIADFLYASARLIVELDGEPHETEERRLRDAKRDAWLKAQGFQILRFPNDLVLMNLGAVLDAVGRAVEARLGRELSGTVAPLSRPRLTPGPPSPAEGGGDARDALSQDPLAIDAARLAPGKRGAP